MKYKLINNQTKEEHLCDKVIINGFDYYESDKTPDKGYKGFYVLGNNLFHTSTTMLQSGCKEVIATNNPNIDIPKVVDEVEKMAKEILSDDEHWQRRFDVIKGYNKSQETHPNSDKDMKSFGKFCADYDYRVHGRLSYEQLLQLWKDQQPKVIYFK